MARRDPARLSEKQIGSRLEFETLLSDILAALFTTAPEQLRASVEHALDQVRNFFQADRCALLSVSLDSPVVSVLLTSSAEEIPPIPTDVTPAEWFPWSCRKLLVEREPVRMARISDLPPDADADRRGWIQLPIRSAWAVPIETGGIVRHLIVLNTVHEEIDWPDALETRLRVLGRLLVTALERSSHGRPQAALADEPQRLTGISTERKPAEAALRRSEARLAAAADLAGLAFYELNFSEGVAYLDDRFRDLCGLAPESDRGLHALEFWMDHLHPDDHPHVLHMRQMLHDGRLEHVSVEYRYLHPERGERWIHHLGRIAKRDPSGRAVVAFGVLRDVTDRKHNEEELRDLSQRLIRAHEEERALLARELHDDVTQRLAVLAIDVGRAEIAGPDAAQKQTMQMVREGLTRLSEDIHSLAYQLHPSVLSELGLAEALRTECERVERQGRIGVSLHLDPLPAGVDKDAALCLYRVAQEALSNVARHAQARAASVRLQAMDHGLLLAVRDDGAGFDPAQLAKAKRLGLASMRERVRLLNGTLDIESGPGRGTTIVAWVPFGVQTP